MELEIISSTMTEGVGRDFDERKNISQLTA
jgi:hypothetical protein